MLETWTTEQAAQLVGAPYRTVRRWLNEGLVCLRLHPVPCRCERLRLVQADLEELWVIASLRQQGASMQDVKRLLFQLSSLLERNQWTLSDIRSIAITPLHQPELAPFEPDLSLDVSLEQQVDRLYFVRFDALRDALRAHPGEQMGDAWELLLCAQEVPIV